jgi:hypothetical protein
MKMSGESAVLNHMSFPSEDMEATGSFFERYFGCKVEHKTEDAWVLKHGHIDIVIEKAKVDAVRWPNRFHFGFELKTLSEVKTIYSRFKSDGICIESEVFNNTRGSRFFARTSCGILFEVNTREDMQPELWKNSK